jgi:A/G-specific adenine glycosylase
MDNEEFKNIIYSHYEKEGRVFPWRENTEPWGVLVSEFMLQQTQTERALLYWTRWMKLWPGPEALNKASLEEVLKEWNGLGYNRRGRYIKECARILSLRHGGKIPRTPEELLPLPGIGSYTAGAIACFAYNYPSVFIETNIRAVMIHFFFKRREEVRDSEITPLLAEVLDRENPRKWYWALMDYGAALKKLTPNPSRKSAHYSRQSPFEGSFRQLRGRLIKSLISQGPAGADELKRRVTAQDGKNSVSEEDLYKALDALKRESMVAESGGVYRIRE